MVPKFQLKVKDVEAQKVLVHPVLSACTIKLKGRLRVRLRHQRGS